MNDNQNLNNNQPPVMNDSIPVSGPIPGTTLPNETANNTVSLGVSDNQTYDNVVGDVINNSPAPTQFINTNVAETKLENFDPVGAPVNNPALNNMTNPTIDETPNLSEMNVDGTYNKMNVAPDYVNDAQVKENVDIAEGRKKVTVPVSKELKTVILIAAILFVFIIVMPFIFDLINKVRFR